MKSNTAICLFYLTLGYASAGEIAVIGEPLKMAYKLNSDFGFSEFYKTEKTANSYSVTCDMGQAIPDHQKKDWYKNNPIPGLKFELRARAAFLNFEKKYSAMGFAVITKNDEILVVFKPLGHYVNQVWDGDVFNSWHAYETDIEVHSELLGVSGYAHFDLLGGNGFYYKSKNSQAPEYFLSNCKRIPKMNLPVYDWR